MALRSSLGFQVCFCFSGLIEVKTVLFGCQFRLFSLERAMRMH